MGFTGYKRRHSDMHPAKFLLKIINTTDSDADSDADNCDGGNA